MDISAEFYLLDPVLTPSAETRAAAEAAMRKAVSALGLEDVPVHLRWYTWIDAEFVTSGLLAADPPRIGRKWGRRFQGMVWADQVLSTGEVFIDADRSPDEAARIVRHEVRHIWQIKTLGTDQFREMVLRPEYDAMVEDDAEAWAHGGFCTDRGRSVWTRFCALKPTEDFERELQERPAGWSSTRSQYQPEAF